jgi:hypothetical protein
MKMTPSCQRGNALLAGLITASILGATLASYLVLVSSQNASITRAQSWNMAIPVAEAGIDEALAHLNYSTNRNSSGWAPSTPFDYLKTNALSDGSSNYYVVGISNLAAPIIVVRGFVPAPNSAGFISRTLRVTTKKNGVYQYAMLTDGPIDMHGTKLGTDSYDSTDPTHSNNGKYPTGQKAKTRDNGDIGTNAGLVDSAIDIGNAHISGKAATGPGGGLTVGPNGRIGSTQFQTNDTYWAAHQDPAHPNVEAGYFTDDMNVDIDDVKLPPDWPTTVASMPVGGTVDGVTYDYVLYSGNYQLSSFSGKLLVLSNATLLVTSSFSMSGQDIIMVSNNASLKLYVAAPTATIAGNGIVNSTGSPTNLWYYGLPTNTSLDFTGNGEFTGVIYAPSAALSLKGGGNSDQDFCGASVTKTATMNGNFNFHYDESLGRQNSVGIHRITTWTEIANPSSAAL